MHVQTGCSGNDSDIVIPSLPCSDSQPADSPCFLMDGLNGQSLVPTVWFININNLHAKFNIWERLFFQIPKLNNEKTTILGNF